MTTTIVDRYWDDAREGDECVSPTFTVTEAHINTYADLTGDHTPVHIDEAYAKTTEFGTRVAHGLLGLSLAWTWDFAGPIKIGDTVRVKFRVGSMRPSKSKPGWGIVVLPSELINQRGEVVQKGEHRLMIPCRPKADA